MPIVGGQMYAEAREQLRNFNELNVLILGSSTREIVAFLEQLSTMHVYINQTLGTNVGIKVHCTGAFDSRIAQHFGLTVRSLSDINETSTKELVQAADIDVIFDQDNVLSKRYAQDNFYAFQTVNRLTELVASCEDFLVGNDIAWLFSNITWNLPLFMRYFDRPGLCRDYFMFMGECTGTHGYTSDQQDKVRYIANRLGQIEYSKDIIQSYIKRMRKAKRNGYSEQDFGLELNYHLGNYYFLIAGVLDSMARLLNNVLKLELNRHQLALEKEDFINANRRKRTGLVRILTKREFTDWQSFLKERRHFIAHEGDMRQSPLVEQNDVLLTNDEVERLVDAQSDWTYMATFTTREVIQALRAQSAQMVRIQHDYKTVAEYAMIVPNANGTKIFQPLRSIEYDYDQLADVMTKFLARLKG